jgi:small subunit ribosomal protein S7
MSRKNAPKKRILAVDPVYNRISVHMLVNRVLKNGKKSIAYRIVYNVLRKLSETTDQTPVDLMENALTNVKPRIEIQPRRRGGAIQQVPKVIRSSEYAQALAIRWILAACQKRAGRDMVTRLNFEISEASKKTGMAFRKKEDLHKTALANQMNARRPDTIVQAIMVQEEVSEKSTFETSTSLSRSGKSSSKSSSSRSKNRS